MWFSCFYYYNIYHHKTIFYLSLIFWFMKNSFKDTLKDIRYLIDLKASLRFKICFIINTLINILFCRILKIKKNLGNFVFKWDELIENKKWKFKIIPRSDMYSILRPHYEQELYPYFLIEDWIFIDIGANVGKYTIYLGTKSPQVNIYSIEPNAQTYKYLLENVLLNNNNNNTHTFNVWFWEKKEQKDIYVPRWFLWRASVVNNFSQNQNNLIKSSINIITLDDFIKDNKIEYNKIRLIKIDVEWFEKEVLKWSKKTLNSLKSCRIIIEIFGDSTRFIKFLGEYDFKFFKKLYGDNYIFEKI